MNQIEMQCRDCRHTWHWLIGSPMLCPQCGHVHWVSAIGGFEHTQHTEKCAKNQTIDQNGVGKVTNGKPLSEIGGVWSLSPREREVLYWVSKGASNRQVAEQLVISVRTVESHLDAVFSKLGVQNRTHATACALQEGFADLNIRSLPDP